MKRKIKILVLALKLLVIWTCLEIVKDSKSYMREFMVKAWYEHLAQGAELLFIDFQFMNYGYADSDQPQTSLQETCQAQLYQKMIHMSGLNFLHHKTVFEIGSGRGGGIYHICNIYSPKQAIGVDLSYHAVDYATRRFNSDGLSYRQGNAQFMPFFDHSADIVLNVESSHCYPYFDLFCQEAYRVLRPQGLFLYADFMTPEIHEEKRRALLDAGFKIKQFELITPQVIRSLQLDSQRKWALINTVKIPFFIKKGLANFAACVGSEAYQNFVSGQWIYVAYVLEKIENSV